MNARIVRLIALVAVVLMTAASVSIAYAQAANPLDGQVYKSPQGDEFNAVWSGWVLTQPDLPMGTKPAYRVTVSIPDGEYSFDGVACLMARTDNGRVAVAREENGAQFIVSGTTEYEIRCIASEMSGFTIIEIAAKAQIIEDLEAKSTNPLVGVRYMPEDGNELYSAVWEGETGWWLRQDKLPGNPKASTLTIYLWPAVTYKFNGKKCELRDRNNVVITSKTNGFEFSTPDTTDVVKYVVSCSADPVSGFSIETPGELEEFPAWKVSDTEWVQLNKLLNPVPAPAATTEANS